MSRLGTSRRRGILTSNKHDSVESFGKGFLPHSRSTAKTPRPRSTATLNYQAALDALAPYLGTDCLRSLTPCSIQGTTNGVVTHTRQVLHTTTANQNNRVLLKVVAFTADVRNDFETIGQTNLANLTQSRVRLSGWCKHGCKRHAFAGAFSRAGTLLLAFPRRANLRTSWLMVGISNFLQRPGTNSCPTAICYPKQRQ